MISLSVIVSLQKLFVYRNQRLESEFSISTALNGVGELKNSFQTPRGLHQVRAKIGKDCPANSVFVKRRPTGEIFTQDLKAQFPDRDWVLTRILWLSGLEKGKNRLGQVDSMQRFIYIHGTPESEPLGIPLSKGCIRMHNADLIELFEKVPVGTRVSIQETP